MANRIQLRRDTTQSWNRVNPILADGEPGLNITTNQIKYGDGNTPWRDLPYESSESSGNGYTGSASDVIGYTGSFGYTGSIGSGYTGSASTDVGYTGSKGDQGPEGISVTLKGSVATVGDLPSSNQSAGDAWIVTADGNMYFWDITNTTWDNIGKIVGYTGSQGAGYTGSQGAGYTGSKGDTGATPNTLPVTGSAYQASSSISVPNSTPVTVVTFTLPSAGTWDVGYWMRAQTSAANPFAGEAALYDSTGTVVPNSEVLAFYDNGATSNKSGTGSARTIITTTGSATYTLRAFASTGSFFALSDGNGRNGVVWVQLTGGYIGYTGSAGVLTGAIPAWTSAGAITIGGAISNPTKPTTRVYDNISYRQVGAKEWEVIMSYLCTNAAGAAAGSGDFLFTLPNSLSFNTTLPSQQVWTGGPQTSVWTHTNYVIPSSSGFINNNGVGGAAYAMVYNSTKFRILGVTTNSGVQSWGSGFFAITGYVGLQLTFKFTST